MEEIVLYALMDTHQVHHNCLLYNQKGSVFYRAGSVQRNKYSAYFEQHIQERLSNGVISRLRIFSDACRAERKQLTVRTRHFQSSVSPIASGNKVQFQDSRTDCGAITLSGWLCMRMGINNK